jgi:hypothetical protein
VDRRHLDFGIDGVERAARGVDLYRPDVARAVEDLALQVGEVDFVGVGEGEAPDAGGAEVQRRRAAQAAGPDDDDVRRTQLLLTIDADLRQQDVPAVAEKLLVVQSTSGWSGRPSARCSSPARP